MRTKPHKYGAYAGYREVDGERIYFFSRMEYNYFLYLRWLKKMGEIKEFRYQPKAFDFYQRAKERPDLWGKRELPLKRKYKSDFYVIENNGKGYYVETVGMLRTGHLRNFKLLHRLFPGIELRVVNKEKFKEIEKSVSKLIPEWERGNFKGPRPRSRQKRRIPHIDEIK